MDDDPARLSRCVGFRVRGVARGALANSPGARRRPSQRARRIERVEGFPPPAGSTGFATNPAKLATGERRPREPIRLPARRRAPGAHANLGRLGRPRRGVTVAWVWRRISVADSNPGAR
jgi:hypothetical protein